VLGFQKLGFLEASRPSSISIITLLFAQLAKQKQKTNSWIFKIFKNRILLDTIF